MADIINFLLLISIMCLLLGVGLSTPFGKVLAVATQYQLVLRGLVANFVIVPCVLTFALQGVPLGPDIVIGLLVLAAVPVAAMAPPFVGMGQGDVAYAVGLMLIVAFLCVPLTPLILALSLPSSEAGLEIDTLKILRREQVTISELPQVNEFVHNKRLQIADNGAKFKLIYNRISQARRREKRGELPLRSD